MPRKKQTLTPSTPGPAPKPRSKPPPKVDKITRRDHYLGAILSGLLSKPYRQDEVPEIIKEANRLADLLLED
jgi:hypothetical protein